MRASSIFVFLFGILFQNKEVKVEESQLKVHEGKRERYQSLTLDVHSCANDKARCAPGRFCAIIQHAAPPKNRPRISRSSSGLGDALRLSVITLFRFFFSTLRKTATCNF